MQSMNGNLQLATNEIKVAVAQKEKAEAERAEAVRRCDAVTQELSGVKRQLTESEVARSAAVAAATVAQEEVTRSRSEYEAALSSEVSAREAAEAGHACAMADLREAESARDSAREEVDALMKAAAAHTERLDVSPELALGGNSSSGSGGGGGSSAHSGLPRSGGGPRTAGTASDTRDWRFRRRRGHWRRGQ